MFNLRQIQSSRRSPQAPPRYCPLTSDTWDKTSGGQFTSQKLVPVLPLGQPFNPDDVHLDRDDDAPGGRRYTLHFSGKLEPFFPSWGRAGRVVQDEGGLGISVASVTTVLSCMADDADLQAWRDGVGHEEADRIAAESATQGHNVHSLCEQYVLNGGLTRPDSATDQEWTIFNLLRQHIDTLDAVIASELTVFNLVRGYSGTIDLIGRKDGKLVLVDLKTYRRERKDEHLQSARLQVTLYALALRESYGIDITSAEIVYANPITGLRVVDVRLDELYPTAIETVDKYYAICAA